MSMASDLARALDRGRWFADAGYEADPWQLSALRSESKRSLWMCSRQAGKSLTASIRALAKAIEEPGCPVLVVAPAWRQASETIRTCVALHGRIAGLPEIASQSVHRLELSTGSRVISLPSSESTIRGFSKVPLLVLDEAAAIPDETLEACLPMLAVSDGEILGLSTPRGETGWFWREWTGGSDAWERTCIPATSCPRLTEAVLEEQKRILGPMVFEQEFMCTFAAADEGIFNSEIIARAFSDQVVPLWE